MTTTTDRDAGTAHVTLQLSVQELEQLARLIKRLSSVPNVLSVRRQR
jgi:(p)ppGpp synthase/HD superfamily hydrolase